VTQSTEISAKKVDAMDTPPPTLEPLQQTFVTRAARFFLVQYTKTGENIPNDNKIYQMDKKYFQWP
jgi:hypothetical protein